MNTLHLVHIKNPMDPRDSTRESRSFAPGQSMAEIFPPAAISHDMAYTLNGRVVEPGEFALTFPAQGDYVTYCPMLAGGGGTAKTILRVVALVAVAYFTAGAGSGWLVGAGSLTGATGFTAALISAGAFAAGALVVNAMLPPPKPPSNTSAASSATYGIDSAKNTSAEGVVVPVPYGNFRFGGNIVDNYVVNDTVPMKQSDGTYVSTPTQWLYMLINVGEGPIASITDILINDQELSAYTDVEVQTRLGDDLQAPLDWFSDTVTPNTLNQKLVDTAYRFYTTQVDVDQLRIDLASPSGLFSVSDKGAYQQVTVQVTIEYKLHSSSTWLPIPTTNEIVSYTRTPVYPDLPVYDDFGTITGYVPYSFDGTEVVNGDFILAYSSDGIGRQVGYMQSVPVYATGGAIVMSGSSPTVLRRSITTPRLAIGTYDIRIKRTSPDQSSTNISDDVYVTDINEITLADVAYRNTALLALKIRLSDQLNGIPTVTHINGGRYVPTWDKTTNSWIGTPSSNPAWITLDMMTNRRFGIGASFARMDLAKWKEWADFCDAKGLTFNGVFDTGANAWDQLMQVFRIGRANLLPLGTKFTLVIEKSDDPVMMFSVANMVAGTFKETWLDMSGRANQVEVTFKDRLDNYSSRTIRIADRAALSRPNALPRSSQVTLMGIVDAQRAYDEAALILNMNRYIRRTVQFSAPIEAIGCAVGEVVLVQHDMPAWGTAGRLAAGSTNSLLQLDRPVTMENGKNYTVCVQFDALLRYTGTIHSIAGNNVTLDNWTGGSDIKRFQVPGIDREVINTFFDGTRYGVTLADVSGLSVGQTWQLWDSNVLEHHSVVTDPGEHLTVTMSAPLTMAPQQFVKWLFGEVNKVEKPFRIQAITGSQEYRRDLTAIEYNASIYDPANAVPTLNYSSLGAPTGVVDPAVIDKVFESRLLVGSGYKTSATVNFHSTQQGYLASDVFLSRNGSSFTFVGTDREAVSVDAVKGDVLIFRVVAKDRSNRNAAVSTAPVITYTVLGKTAPPADVSAPNFSLEKFGVRIRWSDVTSDADIDHYEVRYGGTDWETATFLVNVKATNYLWNVQTVSSQEIWIKAWDTAGNSSTDAGHAILAILAPSAPVVTYNLSGPDEILSWNAPTSVFTIDHYEIREGASFADGVVVDTTKATSYRQKVSFVGNRSYWVAAIDAAGNVGTAGLVSVSIAAPGVVGSSRAEVIDNNALLYWAAPSSGSLPVAFYDVRKGASYASGTTVGSNGNSTFATVFEQQSGIYTYWIAAIDSAGNVGTPIGITATINQPPDYILRTNIDSTFGGGKYSMLLEDGELIGPVNTTETFADHFANNSFSSPADQVAAGYPIYLEPSTTVGGYDEYFDYGAVLPSTTITATLGTTIIDGSVTVACQVSYKTNPGDPWTLAPAGATSVLAAGFRYVYVQYSFTATGGHGLIRVNSLNVKLASKQKSDSGTGTAAIGGTAVTFGVPFTECDTPIVQPNGSTPLIPVVIYSGTANPTGFTVRLYNLSGTDVGGPFSWTARGF